MLTLFSIPKPFEGHTGTIQRNAIRSWRCVLPPTARLVLLGDERGTADMAHEVGARHVPHIERDAYGTPIVSDVFAQGEAHAVTDMVCYINADILLLSDFARTVMQLSAYKRPFLAVGQRTDVDIAEPIAFSQYEWEDWARRFAVQYGTLHKVTGIDYFVYRRGTLGDMPPFALGRWRWDNWILWAALERGLDLIDTTRCVLALHQNHDYSHHGDEAKTQLNNNNALVAATRGRLCLISDATHQMTPDGNITLKTAHPV